MKNSSIAKTSILISINKTNYTAKYLYLNSHGNICLKFRTKSSTKFFSLLETRKLVTEFGWQLCLSCGPNWCLKAYTCSVGDTDNTILTEAIFMVKTEVSKGSLKWTQYLLCSFVLTSICICVKWSYSLFLLHNIYVKVKGMHVDVCCMSLYVCVFT